MRQQEMEIRERETEKERERESETERDSKSTHGKTAQENNSKRPIRSERKRQTDGAREGMSHADRKRQRDRGRDTQALAQFTFGRVHRCASSCLVDIEKPITNELPGFDITDALASSSGIPLVCQGACVCVCVFRSGEVPSSCSVV